MPTVPLKLISYTDDARVMVDTINQNFRLLEFLFNSRAGQSFFGDVYVEYGEAPLQAGLTFALTQGYTKRPIVVLGLATTNLENVAGGRIALVSEPVLGSDGVFRNINVYAIGVTEPIETAYVNLVAICSGRVVSP